MQKCLTQIWSFIQKNGIEQYWETPTLFQALSHTKKMESNSIGKLNICFEHFHIKKNQRKQHWETRPLKRSERTGPLFSTGVWGHEAVLRLLLEHRADPNTLNEDKKTPFHVVSAPLFARLAPSPLHCD